MRFLWAFRYNPLCPTGFSRFARHALKKKNYREVEEVKKGKRKQGFVPKLIQPGYLKRLQTTYIRMTQILSYLKASRDFIGILHVFDFFDFAAKKFREAGLGHCGVSPRTTGFFPLLTEL
ncbi:MAG: hypothetical protein LBK44_05625 [Spirochaetales bacterium]|jgi:hypothetical protein|nr:hypothetical protein [Spirochaetales bacterium]